MHATKPWKLKPDNTNPVNRTTIARPQPQGIPGYNHPVGNKYAPLQKVSTGPSPNLKDLYSRPVTPVPRWPSTYRHTLGVTGAETQLCRGDPSAMRDEDDDSSLLIFGDEYFRISDSSWR